MAVDVSVTVPTPSVGVVLVVGFLAIDTVKVFVTVPPNPSLTVTVMISDLVAVVAPAFEAASRAAAVGV
jgi:hypothetical protein